jgi:hypothetical protein
MKGESGATALFRRSSKYSVATKKMLSTSSAARTARVIDPVIAARIASTTTNALITTTATG